MLTQAVNNAFTAERCRFPGADESCGLWWGFSGWWFCLSLCKEDVLCVKTSFLHKTGKLTQPGECGTCGYSVVGLKAFFWPFPVTSAENASAHSDRHVDSTGSGGSSGGWDS